MQHYITLFAVDPSGVIYSITMETVLSAIIKHFGAKKTES